MDRVAQTLQGIDRYFKDTLRFKVYVGVRSTTEYLERLDWCKNNCRDLFMYPRRYSAHGYWLFANKEDAVLFNLTWHND